MTFYLLIAFILKSLIVQRESVVLCQPTEVESSFKKEPFFEMWA